MTEIQRYDGSSWVDLRVNGSASTPWKIECGLSDVLVAPKAEVTTDARETVNAGDELRIREDGTTIFQGRLKSSGKRRSDGSRKLKAEHRAYELFEESVSFTSSNPTANDVLSDALAASNIGGDFTLTYGPSDTTLANDYEADNRSLKRVFRDITDRTGTIWWVDGANDEITVDEYGGRGLWESINTASDTARVESYDPDNVETVKNDITVNGTGGERVTGTATDSTSISDYGRRSKTVNVSYVTSESEADDYADALLQPDPLPEAELRIAANVGTDPESNLANNEIAVDDTNGTGLDDTLVVEKQTVTQSRVRFDLGQGRAVNLADLNRSEKSKGDNSEPGSVYGEDRIAEGSIAESKLDDLSVSVDKIQDEAVEEAKVRQDAITETKIEDDAISTPKLQAGAITAGKIDASAVTATAIDTDAVEAGKIDADAVGAREIIANEITADEIDTLDLDTVELSVGADTNTPIEFTEIDNNTAIVPESDGACQVGDDTRRFNVISAINTLFENVTTEFTTTDEIEIGADRSEQIIKVDYDGGETALRPTGDDTCALGTSTAAWRSITSHNYIDASPEPLESVDCSELCGYDWYNPPEYLAQRAAGSNEDGGYKRHNPKNGLDLGHVSNWLLEVCKDQQRTIESLADRIDDLEAKTE